MKYQVKDPQGNLHVIEGPDGATPDQVLARAKSLIPSKSQGTDYGQVVGSAIKNALVQPGSMTRDLATNPVTQAKALPELAGYAGALSPMPGGATLGTVLGRQLSNTALKAYGRPEEIPSSNSQILEGGAAALGDVAAIPFIKKAIFGKQIGAAEKAAGVVTRPPDRLPTPGNVGEVLNTLESQLKSGAITDAQTAREAYAISKYVNKNPNLVGKSDEIKVAAWRVGKLAQETLNKLVPGRLEPAQGMAKAMTIPRFIGKAYKAIPPKVRTGLELGAGGDIVYQVINKLLGR